VSTARPAASRQNAGLVWVAAVALVAAVSAGRGAGAFSGPAPPSGGSARALGREMAARRGWTGVQWTCLNLLWTHESGWDADAQNPVSTAYGIPQFLNTTWGAYGSGPKTSDPAAQISDGLDYIGGRYGTPCKAWAFEMSHTPNWY
jgi:hypothetical protein